MIRSRSKEEECKLINARFLVEINGDLNDEEIRGAVKKNLIEWKEGGSCKYFECNR